MTSTGYIGADGLYHRGETKELPDDVSSTYKEWHHDYERKQFAKDIIQPHVNGKPNVKFIEAYPEYSKKYFTQEQIDKAVRDDTGGLV